MNALQEKKEYRLHLLALGDVGSTLLLGLRLLGGDVLSAIGIFDVREAYAARYEQEMNQIAYPFAGASAPGAPAAGTPAAGTSAAGTSAAGKPAPLPPVEIVGMDALFDCDVFVFCASAAVPEVGAAVQDVRMAQLEGNEKLIRIYAQMAAERGFRGLFAVVSDPVDLLCQCAYYAGGLRPEQVRGYGLGVMHARALYYAKREPRFQSYLTEGRAFGPHGKELIIANSIERYDHELSLELTKKVVEANLRMRELGFKPYIAPALSSGAISILETLRGEWQYSAVYQEGIYFGCKNRQSAAGAEAEELTIPAPLQARIDNVKEHLYREGARWR